MRDQRGARWLAQQVNDFGAATQRYVTEEGGDPAHGHSDRQAPPQALYHLTDCMCDRALCRWAQVLREYGLCDQAMVQ